MLTFIKYFNLFKDGNCNISDRYIAKLSGTTYRGNTQKNVADAIRHYGLVPEDMWPWVDGWNNYYSAVQAEVIAQGQKIVEFIDINYEWAVPSIAPNSLKYAPLQTSVYAWNGTQNGVYYRTTLGRNHATVKDAWDNLVYYIHDSYDPFDKRLAKNFAFGNDLIFTLHLKKPLIEFNVSEIQKVRKEKGWEYIMLVRDYNEKYTQGVYQLTDDGLKKLTSADTVDDWVLDRKKDGVLEGVPPDWFKKLII